MARSYSRPIERLLSAPADERRLGPFHLVRQLGRGGFAPVWLAKETYGETELRTAAIKLFAVEAFDDELRTGIAEEARLLCQVEHPNVVRFYSLVFDEPRGLVGLSMELIAGESLEKRLETRGPLPVADALAMGVAVASALSAVHRAGLVHRDIKPANVVAAGGAYKLIDFGIAAAEAPSRKKKSVAKAAPVVLDDLPLVAEGTPSASSSGARNRAGPSGTPGYVDPVCVAESVRAVPSSDLYALGVLLFESLVGKLPAACVPGKSGVSAEVLDGRARAPSLRDAAPSMPDALVVLVDALLCPQRAGRPRSAEVVAHSLERLRREVAGRTATLPAEDVGPFRGLGSFGQGDRDLLFGRTVEVASAVELLRTHGLVTLVGASGSGKSSLGRAGIVPVIAEGALGSWPARWDTCVITPGTDPHAALHRALACSAFTPEEVASELARRIEDTGRGLVLFIDQLEELVTLSEPESRSWAARLLARLGERPVPGLRALAAVRRDMLDQVLAIPELGRTLVRGSMFVAPLADDAWSEVLDGALGAYDYQLEDPTLRVELLAELKGASGAMPLIQFALTELWATRDRRRRILTREGLARIGGIAGALERHADATIEALGADRQPAVRGVLLELTTPQGTRAVRTRTDIAGVVGAEALEILSALERARLIESQPDGYAVTHEALLTRWSTVRAWIAEAREDRLLAEEVELEAARWRKDSDPTLLRRGRRLIAAEELLRRGGRPVSPEARSFIATSRQAERRSRVVSIAAVSALASAAAAVVLYFLVHGASERARLSEALSVAEREGERARLAQRRAEQAEARLAQATDRLRTSESAAASPPPATSKAAPPSSKAGETAPAAPVAPRLPECSTCQAIEIPCVSDCNRASITSEQQQGCYVACDAKITACKSKCR